MQIKEELIGPAAVLAAAILQKVERLHSEFDREIVGSAFEEAYLGLLNGIERVGKEPEPSAKPSAKREKTGTTRAVGVVVGRSSTKPTAR